MDQTFTDTPEAETDCTVLNRLCLQGPDPLFLALSCPAEFNMLCGLLGLAATDGMWAIREAHEKGPGALLDADNGIPYVIEGGPVDPRFETIPWKREALWLVLASVSDTTEEDYKKDISFVERMQRAMGAGIQLAFRCRSIADGYGPASLHAHMSLNSFYNSTVFTQDAQGVPRTDVDHGFYIGYKRGFKAVAVHHGNKTFYGTVPGTTLDEQGIKVDVKVSETYGFVRDLE